MRKVSRAELLSYGIDLPSGKYKVYVKDDLYQIYSVKDDTEGCILVGRAIAIDMVTNSRDAFNALYAKLLAAKFRQESMEITVRQE